jgi:electron transfer flavoprotein beta subunit
MASCSEGPDVRIVVALKHVPLRVEVDALTGVVETSERESGMSYADSAALEWALTLADAWNGRLEAVTVGPPAAEAVLREALAVGAVEAIRVEAPIEASSADVGRAIASVARGADLVVCGDYSLDRGSGSVPAFIAAQLGVGQALGLVAIEVVAPGSLRATRRLDGGRREVLAVNGAAVLSVEGSTARLRRGSLRASLAASKAVIGVQSDNATVSVAPSVTNRYAYRPRTRVVAAPLGATALERIKSVTATSTATEARADPIVMAPSEAADAILEALTRWGYR